MYEQTKRLVTKNGVVFRHRSYHDPRLLDHIGETVDIRLDLLSVGVLSFYKCGKLLFSCRANGQPLKGPSLTKGPSRLVSTDVAPPTTSSLTGMLSHRAIAEVLYADADQGRGLDPIVRRILNQAGVPARDRATYVTVSSAVTGYLRRGRPGPAWQLAAAEYPIGDAIADLVFVWKGADSIPGERPPILLHEVKTGISRSVATSTRTRTQLLRLLAGGESKWGDRFVGVRLVVPALRIAHLIQRPEDLLLAIEPV